MKFQQFEENKTFELITRELINYYANAQSKWTISLNTQKTIFKLFSWFAKSLTFQWPWVILFVEGDQPKASKQLPKLLASDDVFEEMNSKY